MQKTAQHPHIKIIVLLGLGIGIACLLKQDSHQSGK